MEAQGYSSEMWVLEAMDFLWFDQIILFPGQTCKTTPNFLLKKSFSQVSSPTTCSHEVDSSSEESDDDNVNKEIRGMRLNHHVRCHSSSPKSAKKQSKSLQKTMSLGDLELEEVKGFMDLGFVFKKENLSRRMMRLIPGLRTKYEINDEDAQEIIIMRPYLSEAWVNNNNVKRPDYSPFMNVRIGGDFSASDMKKNLKCWARTVALAVQQEC